MLKLTNRESEILRLAGEGMSAKEIANVLYCSTRTVEFHLANLYAKLQVSNRVQALRRAVSLGLLSNIEHGEMAIR